MVFGLMSLQDIFQSISQTDDSDGCVVGRVFHDVKSVHTSSCKFANQKSKRVTDVHAHSRGSYVNFLVPEFSQESDHL